MTETTTPTVTEAWANVMGDVRALDKGDRNNQQGFNFRGVDATMNAVGPALRRHGVAVVPTGVTNVECTTYTTKSGTVMRDVVLVVAYQITGPAGDTMPGAAAGEASDAGDKAMPKAMSVAYRTFLLQALCLPTQDTDPDANSYERAEQTETPTEAVLRGLNNAQDGATDEQVMAWADTQGIAADTTVQRAQATALERIAGVAA